MQQEFVLDIRHNELGDPYLHFFAQFFSDIHLGTKHSRAKRVTHCLQHTNADQTFIVGDYIDGEDMAKKRRWNFPELHRQVVAHFFRRNKVKFTPGNHDMDIREQQIIFNEIKRFYRNLCGKIIYGIEVAAQFYYTGSDGKNYLVKHGDLYDPLLGSCSTFGNAALNALAHVDSWVRLIPGCGHRSIAAGGKRCFKRLVDKIWHIRKNIEKDLDADPSIHGIVTGHSHESEITRTPGGKWQLNDGCCTQHAEFLAQDQNGVWALIQWHKSHLRISQKITKDGIEIDHHRDLSWASLGLDSFYAPPKLIEDKYTERADRIIRLIYRLWPPKDRQSIKKFQQFSKAANETLSSTAYIPLPNPRRDKRLAETAARRKAERTLIRATAA